MIYQKTEMVKKVLVIGFGNIGCRHVQSLLKNKIHYEIHILETSKANIEKNLKIINANMRDFVWHNNLEEVPLLDIAIVATSSAPRFDIMKYLLKIGFKTFLIEKIVFQSEKQFNFIQKTMIEKGATAFCNFGNRYVKAYNEIKKIIQYSESKISIEVNGGLFGLGCNAIHYIDLLQFFREDNHIEVLSNESKLLDSPNKRGDLYKEFYGDIAFKNRRSDTILIRSNKNINEVTIKIESENDLFILNQGNMKMKIFKKGQFIEQKDFYVYSASELTHILIDDIDNKKCKMATIDETFLAHIALFKVFNKHIYKKPSTKSLCPIT
jgi:hypothetical protein